MAIRIDGTNTTANPGITGADTDTGLQLGTDELKLVTGGSEAVTVDSSQNVGIGTSSPGSLLELEKNGATQLRMTRTNTVSNYCQIKAAGNNSEQLTITTDPTGQGSGFIAFENSGSECMRILSSGGLTFNGDTATANALDDYEEGTWTPTLFSLNGNLSVTYGTITSGYYTKIGRLVQVSGRVDLATSNSSGDSVFVGGFPFTSMASSTSRPGYGPITEVRGFAASKNPHAVLISSNSAEAQLRRVPDTGGSSNPLGTDTTNSTRVVFTAQYIVA